MVTSAVGVKCREAPFLNNKNPDPAPHDATVGPARDDPCVSGLGGLPEATLQLKRDPLGQREVHRSARHRYYQAWERVCVTKQYGPAGHEPPGATGGAQTTT